MIVTNFPRTHRLCYKNQRLCFCIAEHTLRSSIARRSVAYKTGLVVPRSSG